MEEKKMKIKIVSVVLTIFLMTVISSLAGVDIVLVEKNSVIPDSLNQKINQPPVFDFIIISPSEFSNNLEPLLAHKKSHGIETQIVTLEEIYGGTYFPVEGCVRQHGRRLKYHEPVYFYSK